MCLSYNSDLVAVNFLQNPAGRNSMERWLQLAIKVGEKNKTLAWSVLVRKHHLVFAYKRERPYKSCIGGFAAVLVISRVWLLHSNLELVMFFRRSFFWVFYIGFTVMMFLVRFCGNLYSNLRYCDFIRLSGFICVFINFRSRLSVKRVCSRPHFPS